MASLRHTVLKHNLLMRDFPLNELLAATDLPKIHDAVTQIFAHLNKKLKTSCVILSSIQGRPDQAVRIQCDAPCHWWKRSLGTSTTKSFASSAARG